jgi:hypothetical protein
MRRILAFFSWQESEWRTRAQNSRSAVLNSENVLAGEGRLAYALRQASIRAQMVENFKAQWNVSQLGIHLTTMLDGRDPYVMVECH